MAKDFYIKASASSSTPTWGSITGTLSSQTDLQTALNAKEPTITAGTTSQYWRGDKSWQTLDKTAVGLSNVDNTSDASKPISTATQTALDAKGYALTGNLNGGTVGLGVTTYIGFGVGTINGVETQRRSVVSAGTVKGVYLRTNASMTGTLVLTVMKNGSATTMTFTIATGSAAGLYSTTSNSFSVADGDEISIRIAQSTAISAALYGFGITVR